MKNENIRQQNHACFYLNSAVCVTERMQMAAFDGFPALLRENYGYALVDWYNEKIKRRKDNFQK